MRPNQAPESPRATRWESKDRSDRKGPRLVSNERGNGVIIHKARVDGVVERGDGVKASGGTVVSETQRKSLGVLYKCLSLVHASINQRTAG
jgi:hypothetical protein